ncbi:hypothetical protein FOA43_004453 [Brettanomyces nanus]|uniref:Gem-associated protein 2 n=1 Tax=Eeniella nana TaxID=13502 RepID=A0A875SAF8_EENNA|nr:uncharacterized protein FOA43_004453 [Brettanomyces nanus]QPG77055.1 hypothetical protein FOA43_004453 [Brettanomyces nanus]
MNPEKRHLSTAYPVDMMKRRRKSNENQSYSSESLKINSKIESTLRKSENDAVKGPLDPVFGQHRAFPISINTETIDLDKSPSNVMEYLAQVRLEAEKDGIKEDDGFYYKPVDLKDVVNAPENPLEGLLSAYKQKRTSYEQYRSHLTEINAISLPDTHKEWKYFIFNNKPTFDFVAQIVEENEDIKLVVYFTKWLNTDVDANFEEWLFMVLEALDQFQSASNISVLRGLCKKAKKQLANQLDARNSLIMNRILTIVGCFYGQRDLIEKKIFTK